jgi:hypothetical protein
VICYPLLRWLKGAGQDTFSRLGGFLARLARFICWRCRACTRHDHHRYPLGGSAPGGWDILLCLPFFLIGFVLVSHNCLQLASSDALAFSGDRHHGCARLSCR